MISDGQSTQAMPSPAGSVAAADGTADPARPHAGLLSRRRFVMMLAATGVLAGCSPGRGVVSPTPTPRLPAGPLSPTTPIALSNATRIGALGVLNPQDGRLRGLAWSPDGAMVASGGAANIHVWNVQSGSQVATWQGHTNQIYGMAWCAANSLVASASLDGTIRLWHASDGSVAAVLGGSPDLPLSVAWSPDGVWLAAGDGSGVVNLWNVQTRQVTTTQTSPALSSTYRNANANSVFGVSWSPDGRRLLSTRYDGYVEVWDASSGRALATLSAPLPNSVAWAPDGRRFTSSHDDGSVRLWDATSYRSSAVFAAHPEDGWAFPMAWSSDGSLLVVARSTGLVQWYETSSGTEVAAQQGHTAGVWALGWSSDGLRVATASNDGTVRLWGVR